MKIRNSIWRRGTCLLLAVLFLFTDKIEAKADMYWPEGPSINTPSAIVIEINSGAVLYEKNSDEQNYPASITKIMTTMLALEYAELDEIVTFSADAVFKNEGNTSHIARDLNEQMTMEQCLYAVMLESANECAYAVAEHIGQKLGGDYQTFIDLMNQRAAEIGCTNTHFANANGLPDKNHYTSAHDMALISAEAYKNEAFRIIIETRIYRIPPTNKHSEITPLNNHHAMISNYKTREHLYEYCTGGKTGYTNAAGATLVSYAEKDGLALVCVVMKTNSGVYYKDTRNMFEHCFQNFQKVSIGENGTAGEDGSVSTGIMNNYEAFVKLDENAQIVLPITADLADVEMSLVNEDLPSGVIAQLNYTYGGHVAGCANVVFSNAKVEENYFEGQEKPSDVNVVVIKLGYIFTILGIIVGIGAVILIGKRLYDNYYVIRHDMEVKKQRRERFRPVSGRKKKWKKKDRMFK